MKDCPGPVVRSRHLAVAASLPQPLVAGPCLQHRGSGGRPLAGSSAPMRPISGLSSCAARSRMIDALAALLVASPGSGPPGSPNLSPRFSGRASRMVLAAPHHETAAKAHDAFFDVAHPPFAPSFVQPVPRPLAIELLDVRAQEPARFPPGPTA